MTIDRFGWEEQDVEFLPRTRGLKYFDESQHPRDEHGRWTDSGAVAFISPNVADLKIDGAIAGLHSPRQEALRKASADVDSQLGKTPVEAHSVVGAWSDGAENSLKLEMPKDWSFEQAKIAMAMKGWLGDQKSALVFRPDPGGNAFMASFNMVGQLDQIHQQLLDDGLAFHTLEPTSDGAVVHIYGEDQATADAVDKAAGKHDTQAGFTFGNGAFIGTTKQDGTDREQRDDARRAYEAIIRHPEAGAAFQGRDVNQIWQDIRGRWGGELTPQAVTGEHPGQGYSKDAFIHDGVIHTDNVNDAARALAENRPVELTQPRTASVLIDKLGEISRDMIDKGQKAPNFDLCKVMIKGTSLFCASTQNIPRVQMPQIRLGQDTAFAQYLKGKGYTVELEQQRASFLRATQSELNGGKVAAIARKLRNQPGHQGNPLFVSNDDYILDGHHRWAAKIGLDAADNNLTNDTKLGIARVNISITKLLEEAEAFTGGAGKLSMADEAADAGDVVETIADPERVPTPEQEAARRAERQRPENVSEYELPRVNYSLPFDEQQQRKPDMFESEAEYNAIGGALADYKKATGDGDAYAVNRTLRGKEEITPRIQQAISNIDLGFTRTAAPIINYNTKQPKDGWLYRGISNRTPLDLKVGDEFIDDAFGSFTINKDFAQQWARAKGPGGTLLKVTVPAGTKVMPLMDSSGQDEGEVLVNRGTRMRVTKVTGNNIEMVVLP
jgi:hypothetical protein